MLRIFFALAGVFSYGYNTHRYLGGLYENYIKTNDYKTYESLNSIFNGDFQRASIWADVVKRKKNYTWTKKYHYVNINNCGINDNLPSCEACVISGIQQINHLNLTYVEKHKFLFHLLMDITQPLHVYGIYTGGNRKIVIRNKNFRNKTTNLHSLWDSELPEHFINNYPYHPTIYNVTLLDVINDNINIGCNWVYNFKNDYIIFENYFNEFIIRRMFDNYMSLMNIYFKLIVT